MILTFMKVFSYSFIDFCIFLYLCGLAAAVARTYTPTVKHCRQIRCYMNWLSSYIELHVDLSRQLRKPLVIEEFGLNLRLLGPWERSQVP